MSRCSPGSDLVLLSASMSIALAADLTADDTNILACLFSAIGDNLAIIAAKKQICEDAQDEDTQDEDTQDEDTQDEDTQS